MVKRIFWLTVGLLVGSGGSFWLMVKLRERVDRYRPERLQADVTGAVRGLRSDLRSAVADGRTAMHQREAAIHSELGR